MDNRDCLIFLGLHLFGIVPAIKEESTDSNISTRLSIGGAQLVGCG